jgi:hypothetical protein
VLTPLPNIAAPRIDGLPGDLQAQLKRQFWKRHDASGTWEEKHAAQDWLNSEVAVFERERLSVAFDDHEIRQRASRAADLCKRMVRLDYMQDHARTLGINPPEVGKRITRISAAKRLTCPRWWRRQMRKHYTRRAESHLRAAGFVHRHRQVYASDRAVAWRRERKTRDRALLQELVAVSDAGDQLNLFEVVDKSQANPALRRAELMTRLSGFEEVAKIAGHEALFVTLTTPSAYHATLANGSVNPLWEKFTPSEGQQWLTRMWARARSKLKRLSIVFYGFRIAEPHHDGTPHWHMVLFATKVAADCLRNVLKGVWLSDYSHEAGAQEHRAKFERINPLKGSATGYLAKYVAKNIDGFQVGEDFETVGVDARSSVDRVAAWASTHGIRQFQQLGGPPVTVWRELRRIRTVCELVGIEMARVHADAGDWCAFINALGGIGRGRAGRVTLRKEFTGEINQYDEVRDAEVIGVQHACGHVRTRLKVWRIEKARRCPEGESSTHIPAAPKSSSSLGPVSITVRGSQSVPSVPFIGAHASRPLKPQVDPPWMH